MNVHVALLRGINVGGKNRLPMKDLGSMFEDAGCRSVVTYIQSGNVVFQAAPALARRIPSVVTKAIAEGFDIDVPIMTRTAQELAKIARGNPFLKGDFDIDQLHVAFLAERPVASSTKELDPNRSPPDVFAVRGREIFLRLPNGVGRTKLNNTYFESKLRTVSTLRNWRTVLRLLELAGENRKDTR